jgi:chorismate mutase/prephenate dehydrogenase
LSASNDSQNDADRLEDLRERMRRLDLVLIANAAERIELARRIGETKRRQNLPTVDYAQERAVLERARDAARERGLEPTVAEELLARLIRASVSAQDEDRLRVGGLGAGKTAVLVGGAGRMGRWMARFLSAQGYTTGALDPAAPPEENAWATHALSEADLVVFATPPSVTALFYREWATRPPKGVITDLASIKGPLLEPIRALAKAGGRVASLHPMFGPSIVLLRDADVVICDTGDAEATRTVEDLFALTTARLVRIPLEDHDRIMADLLSLAHATAIAFALALPESEHPVRSTTFQALESLAAAVTRESPDVYYEIQVDNAFSGLALLRLEAALKRLVSAVADRDAAQFRALLEEGRRRTPDPAIPPAPHSGRSSVLP